MNFRDFRFGWRLLLQERGYSAVVVLSLAVGFAACFLLLAFVRYSYSYDQDVAQAERVFLIKNKVNTRERPAWNESTPLPYLEVARASGMAEAVSVVMPLKLTFKVGRQLQAIDVAAVDPAFQAVFGVVAQEGDLATALSRPDTLALTKQAAIRLFGSAQVLGKQVEIAGKPYQVVALLPDRPSNSTLHYDALAGSNTNAWDDEERKHFQQAWGNINGARIYVRLKADASAEALEQQLQSAADHSPFRQQLGAEELQKLGGSKLMDIRLGALPAMYFDRDTANTPFAGQHGDQRAVTGLSVVALLILLLAATNYVNLATVRTLRRQREIAVRKVLGAAIGRLVGQFLAESMVVALLSTVLGLLLAAVLLPLFSELVDRKLDNVFTPVALLVCLTLGALVGLAAGLYPAWVALRVRPQQTLSGRGSSETPSGLWFRRCLTVLQFATAMGLTAVTLAIAWQTRYASQADPGFDTAPLLVLELPAGLDEPASRGLREALTRIPGVSGVAATADPVGRDVIGAYIRVSLSNGRWARVLVHTTSANFFEVFGLRPLAGRVFDSKLDKDTDGFKKLLINESTARALGFATPEAAVGQILTTGSGEDTVSGPIIGVAPEIRYESLRGAPQARLYFASHQTPTLTVRGSGDLREIERAADALQRQYFPNDLVQVRRAPSYFAQNYADDLRLAKLLALATLVAIAIAAFGIYVLSAYSVQRLAKQIVLRKLFGAERLDVARLVGREFAVMLAVGAAVGLPLAIFATQKYLAPFSERAPVGVSTPMAAILIVAAVTVASTLRYTVAAMRMSPARILRD